MQVERKLIGEWCPWIGLTTTKACAAICHKVLFVADNHTEAECLLNGVDGFFILTHRMFASLNQRKYPIACKPLA